MNIDDAVLDDLRGRLQRTRYPADIDNDDWRYGTNTACLKKLVDYSIEDYNRRKVDNEINSFANYRCEIESIPIHFSYEQGKGLKPIPLILTHGWPWTF